MCRCYVEDAHSCSGHGKLSPASPCRETALQHVAMGFADGHKQIDEPTELQHMDPHSHAWESDQNPRYTGTNKSICVDSLWLKCPFRGISLSSSLHPPQGKDGLGHGQSEAYA